MAIPQTTSYTPALRIREKRNSDEVDNWLMKKGQRMYKFYSSPNRPWPLTEEGRKRTVDLVNGSILLQLEKERVRRAIAKQQTDFIITDVPSLFHSFIPCRGVFIKKAIAGFKTWREKRAQRKFEDWVFKEKKDEKCHHGLLQLVRLGK